MMIADVAERAAELEQLCRAHHVRRLDLFGSATTGRLQFERSDLDFLVVRAAIKNPYFLQSVEQTRTRVYEA